MICKTAWKCLLRGNTSHSNWWAINTQMVYRTSQTFVLHLLTVTKFLLALLHFMCFSHFRAKWGKGDRWHKRTLHVTAGSPNCPPVSHFGFPAGWMLHSWIPRDSPGKVQTVCWQKESWKQRKACVDCHLQLWVWEIVAMNQPVWGSAVFICNSKEDNIFKSF